MCRRNRAPDNTSLKSRGTRASLERLTGAVDDDHGGIVRSTGMAGRARGCFVDMM